MRTGILKINGYCLPSTTQQVKILKEDDTSVEVVGFEKDSKPYLISKNAKATDLFKYSLESEGKAIC